MSCFPICKNRHNFTMKVTSNKHKHPICWRTYILVCIFGIGSWIAINGLFVELPLFVDRLPEKWNLPSYLTILIQFANIGVLIYAIGKKCAPRLFTDKSAIVAIVTVGSISCIFLAFFWDEMTTVFNAKHSVALLSLSFFLASVDCLSTVVFLTFMANFPPIYISALMVGETLSSMLPGFIALAQGVGGDNSCSNNSTNSTSLHDNINFGPNVFFIFLFLMMVACGAAFLALNFLPFAKKQHVRKLSMISNASDDLEQLNDEAECLIKTPEKKSIRYKSKLFIYLLVINAWINCMSNSIIPSIQVYACKPYGSQAYHLAVKLSSIASALTLLAAVWIRCRSTFKVTCFASVYTILSAYIIVLAALSPSPPLNGSTIGSVLVVAASIISSCLITYTKVTLFTMMRNIGERALFCCGITAQIGSFLGAVIIFPLVNVAKVFHEAKKLC